VAASASQESPLRDASAPVQCALVLRRRVSNMCATCGCKGGKKSAKKGDKKLSPKQKKIAKMGGDPKKIDADDFKALRAKKGKK